MHAPHRGRKRSAPGVVILALFVVAGSLGVMAIPPARADVGSWSAAGHLNQARLGHTATLLADGRVLVTGGCTPRFGSEGKDICGDHLATTELYDPNAPGGMPKWRLGPPLSQPRAGHSATLLPDGRVVVAGGCLDPDRTLGVCRATPTAEMFNPAAGGGTGAWIPAQPMKQGRRFHTATLLAGTTKVLVAGGQNGTGALASAEVFDASTTVGTDPWTEVASLNHERSYHSATVLNGPACGTAPAPPWCGRVLAVAGFGLTASRASVELYDPVADAWASFAAPQSCGASPPSAPGATCPGSLAQARTAHTASPLASGEVFVAGGHSGEAAIASTEAYDPATGTWAGAGPLAVPRSTHTATVLQGCKVLVVGGRSRLIGAGGARASAELHDPAAGTRAAAGEMAQPRSGVTNHFRGATATVLGDGTVLVVGGTDSVLATPPTLTERYTPGVTGCGPVAGESPNPPGGLTSEVEVTRIEPAFGPASGGTYVTIRGSGFGDNSVVRFGDQVVADDKRRVGSSNIGVGSERVIRVIAPQMLPGPVEVTVATPGGTPSLPSVGSRFTAYASAPAGGAWVDANRPSTTPRVLHSVTRLADGRVLVVGGSNSENGFLSSAEVYDPAAGTWSETASPSAHKSHHTATLLDPAGCRGGSPPVPAGYPCSSVLVLDVPPLEGQLGSQLGGSRTVHAELYDPQALDPSRPGRRGAWSAATPPTETFEVATTTLLADGDILVVGTRDGTPAHLFHPAERTGTTQGRWEVLPGPTSVAGGGSSATRLGDGRVLVAGGSMFEPPFGATARPGADLYDPATKSWSATAPMAVGRNVHSATLLADGRVLVAGGNDQEPSNTAEVYDPAAPDPARPGRLGAWSPTFALGSTRWGHHTGTRLSDGTVVIAGGTTAGGLPADVAEVYDPGTNRWRPAASSLAPRVGGGSFPLRNYTATLLDGPRSACGVNCGRVLVVGGEAFTRGTFDSSITAAAELFSPTPRITAVEPGVVPVAGGTPLTISGSGLAPASAVTIGGATVACGLTEAACHPDEAEPDGLLRVVAPPSSRGGPVDVVITTTPAPGTTLTSAPARLTYAVDPTQVIDLVAEATSPTGIRLSFSAADDGTGAPARSYLVRQASAPVTTDAAFDDAAPLCEAGVCRFTPSGLGARLDVALSGATPGATYHYALRPIGATGAPGALSNSAAVTMPGGEVSASACRAAVAPGPGQLAYAAGAYHLVGLPADTVVPASSPLYSWFDKGAGGAYATQGADEAVAAGRGYWAWFACPAVVDVAGPGVDTASLPLGAYRASMVGNPSATNAVTVSGHDFAAAWDPTLNAGAGGYRVSAYREPQRLEVGAGTWAFRFTAGSVELGP